MAVILRIAGNRKMEGGRFTRKQMGLELNVGSCDVERYRIAINPGTALFTIQSLVGHHDGVGRDFIGKAPPSVLATGPADLEDVGKVSSEHKFQWDIQRVQPIVDEADLLVRDVMPDETRADDVNCASGNNDLPAICDVDIRQVGGKDEVVGLYR